MDSEQPESSQELSLKSIELHKVFLSDIIGRGTYSTVYNIGVTVDQDDGSQTIVPCVAKELHLGEEFFERLKNACVVLQKPEMKHQNIVGFIGVWFRSRVELPLIVFEKMDLSLADYLQTNTEVFVRMSLLRDVSRGVEFLHDKMIIDGKAVVHGEVTAKSVFVSIRKDCHPAAIAKIGDLELSRILGQGVCTSLSCTSYKSPEAWLGSHIPSFTDDIYAIGVLMIHTMLQEYPRYESLDDPERFSTYLKRLHDQKCALCPYIEACLHKNPKHRPPISSICCALDAVCDRGVSAKDLSAILKADNKLKEVKRKSCSQSLTILLTGKTGSGKSAIVNGLVGAMVSTEGEMLTSSTPDVTMYGFFKGGVQFCVVDTPGLQDRAKTDKETLSKIKEQISHTCKSVIDLVIYCIDMTHKRIDRSDEIAISHLTKCFGESIWKNAVFVLTFANNAVSPPSYEGTETAWFEERIRSFEWELHVVLTTAEVSEKISTTVPVAPAGYWRPTAKLPDPWKLPDRHDWFNCFWLACAFRMEKGASAALFKSQSPRLTTKPLSKIEGTAIDRSIYVPSEYVVIDSNGEIIGKRALAVSAVGMAVGGGAGALLGTLGGPIGIVVVGIAGAAAGAATGAMVGAFSPLPSQ